MPETMSVGEWRGAPFSHRPQQRKRSRVASRRPPQHEHALDTWENACTSTDAKAARSFVSYPLTGGIEIGEFARRSSGAIRRATIIRADVRLSERSEDEHVPVRIGVYAIR